MRNGYRRPGQGRQFAAEASGADQSRRWIAVFRREVARRGVAELDLLPPWYFGLNDLELADIAGNVWERTEKREDAPP